MIKLSGYISHNFILYFFSSTLFLFSLLSLNAVRFTLVPDLLIIESSAVQEQATLHQGMLNSVNTIQPEIQRCFRFERGRCQRGQSCRFIHSEDSLNLANNVGISFQSSVPVQFGASVASSGNHGSSVKVCRHFRQKGWCAFGDSCQFLHSSRVPGNKSLGPVNSTLSSEHIDLLVLQDAADDVICKPIRTSKGIAEKKICKFYKAGFCRYGQKCHYRHLESSRKSDGRGIHVGGSSLNEQCVLLQSSVNCAGAADIAEAEQQKHENVVDKKTAFTNIVDQQHVSKSRAGSHILSQLELKKMRETEIQQLRRRYPKAQEVNDLGEALFKFVFEPTDPDWPYDVKQIHMEVSFPQNYPAQMMIVKVKGSERIPAAVERSLTESIENWVTGRYNTAKTTECWELMFRAMLQWLDKNSEILMTDALKEYKRELVARAAGLEFVSAAKLRQMYPDAANSSESTNRQQSATNDSTPNANADNCVVEAVAKLDLDIANDGSMVSEDGDKNCSPGELKTDVSLQSRRKGTEVKLCGLQLTNGAATLVASQITLLVICNRCTNTSEVHLIPGQIYQAACSRCHVNLLIEFSSMIAHQMSAVIGWLNLDGCRAFDLVIADSQFMIGCIGCAKEEKVISLSPGTSNSTWCRHCHQKLTVFVENVRFLQISASLQIDASKAIQVDVKKRIKTVRDPAIQEGLPLPNNGTCKHYKKSFRWLRFPCCGKAYPCDKCHNELEVDHEMKLANRMICGFCAKEQAYSAERPCVSCSNIMTNKSTAHWEGGKGCRDQIKMSRNDSKKYSNSMKTQSSSSSEQKTDTSKKNTKLRHV